MKSKIDAMDDIYKNIKHIAALGEAVAFIHEECCGEDTIPQIGLTITDLAKSVIEDFDTYRNKDDTSEKE